MAVDAVQRRININPEAQEAILKKLEVVKVAMIITSITAIFFFAIYPSILTFLLAGSSILMRDIHTVAQNISKIISNPEARAQAEASQDGFIEQLGKKTFFMGSILNSFRSQITIENLTGYLRFA